MSCLIIECVLLDNGRNLVTCMDLKLIKISQKCQIYKLHKAPVTTLLITEADGRSLASRHHQQSHHACAHGRFVGSEMMKPEAAPSVGVSITYSPAAGCVIDFTTSPADTPPASVLVDPLKNDTAAPGAPVDATDPSRSATPRMIAVECAQ